MILKYYYDIILHVFGGFMDNIIEFTNNIYNFLVDKFESSFIGNVSYKGDFGIIIGTIDNTNVRVICNIPTIRVYTNNGNDCVIADILHDELVDYFGKDNIEDCMNFVSPFGKCFYLYHNLDNKKVK